MKTGCIYKIENLVNGKVYIGLTVSLVKRWSSHRSGMSGSVLLINAMNKYGLDNFSFSVIEDNLVESCLSDREIYWIKFYDSYLSGYNMTEGGEMSPSLLPEVKAKISRNHFCRGKFGENNPHFGKKRSQEVRDRMSKSHVGSNNINFGKPRSPEVRKKISESLKRRHSLK